jgi:FAD synthase
VGATAADVAPGIYAGWASVGTSSQVYKMVMSVGFNPFFDNAIKTVGGPARVRAGR